ncbi:MAG: hypothetical protein LW750_04200 [Bacteroidetes bacterium]|jgi:hypothetical protein|nr:hypothetical protein [Bacteroidota bacterium]
MKKVLSFVAIAAMVSLAACGNDEAEKKRIADSTAAANAADSTAKANDAKRIADSTTAANVADSTAKAAEAQRIADSTAAANEKKGGSKPKPKAPVVNPEKPKVGATRGGN